VAQKTTLVPSGIPGQVYGSFAGKVAEVSITIVGIGTVYMAATTGQVEMPNSTGSIKISSTNGEVEG
jgi:hypothetical protein